MQLLLSHFLLFTLVLSRVSGLVMTAPLFGPQSSAPMRVRALLAVAMALVMTPTLSAGAMPNPGNTLNYLVFIGSEMLIGLVIGLGVTILFSGVQVAGQLIGQLSGMAIADVFDPAFNQSSPIFTQILLLTAMAVFVLIDGHLLVVAALLDTFVAIPPGTAGFNPEVVDALTAVVSQSFLVGIRASAPVVTSLLLATFILGLVSRTMPQLNILAVGFGLNSLITQATLLFSLGGAAWAFQDQLEWVLTTIGNALIR